MPTGILAKLDLNGVEAINFEYFRTKTLRVLPGINRLVPWEQLMLQISQSEPSVLSAAIAVGSIHRNFESDRWPTLTPSDVELQKTIAQRQYIKAMRLLRDRLSDQGDPQRAEIALISCFLFICLELIQSDIMVAVHHLRSGLKILREKSRGGLGEGITMSVVRMADNAESVVDHFLGIFGRLDYQSTMFGESLPQLLVVPSSNKTKDPLWVPPSFAGLQEARHYMDTLVSAAFAFRGHVVHDRACPAGRPADRSKRLRARWAHINYQEPKFEDMDARLPVRQDDLESRFTAWKKAFDRLTAKNIQTFTPEEHRDVKLARMDYLILIMVLKECLSTRQTFFDQHLDEFKEVVELAEALEDGESSIPNFSIVCNVLPPYPDIFPPLVDHLLQDMATHGPLYYVALKCRDSVTRHKAVDLLLRSRRREGMWDGFAIGQFAMQIVALEEACVTSAGPDITCDQIPESSRFSDVTLDFSDDFGRGRLYLGRFQHETNSEWIVQETNFNLFQLPWKDWQSGFGESPCSAPNPPELFSPAPAPTPKASFELSGEQTYGEV